MSMTMDDSIKRWTAKWMTALVIEGWVEDAKRGMDIDGDRGCSAAA